MPILTRQPLGHYKKTKLATEEIGPPGADGAPGADGRDGSGTLSDLAKVEFLSVAWADTMWFTDFTSASGLSYDPEFIVESGITLNTGIAAGTYYISGMYSANLSPIISGIDTPVSYKNNSGNAPPGNPSVRAQSFTGTVGENYKVAITRGGDYGTAECTVTRESDGTNIVNDQVITYDTYIVAENGVEFKWTQVGPASFSQYDIWTISCGTGNFKYSMYEIHKTGTASISSFEMKFINDDSKYVSTLTADKQYIEGTDWTAATHSGPGIGWRMGITTDGSQTFNCTQLLILLGDSRKFRYHPAT